MNNEIRPNEEEIMFLDLSYNKFYDLFDEVMAEDFWNKPLLYRFTKIKDAFAIYSELLNYEPIKYIIEAMKEHRPPMEAQISNDLFKCIRHIFSHFPFFDSWDEVWINKSIVNWHRPGKSIDKFLEKYSDGTEIKYRFWDSMNKEMTYLSIHFSSNYPEGEKIYLKDILQEKDGVKFSFLMMKQILDTQVAEE